MAEEKLPRLTEAHVRGLASEKSFDRGEAYYHDGSVLEPVRQERELRARCQGSDYEPYQVSATLSKSGIAETSCTCPYDFGGVCKHIVALLLTYVHEPQSFRSIPPLTTLLAGRSREELIDLIGELIKREPELLSLVELSVETEQAARGNSPDVSAYRRRTRGALRRLKRSNADAETRRAWLETLLEAELADIEMGGIDLAPSAREAILEHANDEEWSWIEERLNAAMSKSGGLEREALARFLAAGRKRHAQAAKRKKPGAAKH